MSLKYLLLGKCVTHNVLSHKSGRMNKVASTGFVISLAVVLFVYGLLMWNDRASKEQTCLLLLVILQLFGYFIIYLVTPFNLSWHIRSSMDRLLFHLLPMSLFFYFVTIHSVSILWDKKPLGSKPHSEIS